MIHPTSDTPNPGSVDTEETGVTTNGPDSSAAESIESVPGASTERDEPSTDGVGANTTGTDSSVGNNTDESSASTDTEGQLKIDVAHVKIDVAHGQTEDINKNINWLEWSKALGMPLITLLVTLIGGYYLNDSLKAHEQQEARESKEREMRVGKENLYAQLLIQREQSDALVRKDMFGVVINRFLAEPKQEDLETKVLQLELLANNFSQSLDLTSLFKDLERKLTSDIGLKDKRSQLLLSRLDSTGLGIVNKQVIALSRRGYNKRLDFKIDARKFKPQVLFSETIPFSGLTLGEEQLLAEGNRPRKGTVDSNSISLKVVAELLGFRFQQREMSIRVQVYITNDEKNIIDRSFDIGLYSFPMLDNIQLPFGLRLAVVITSYEPNDLEVAGDLYLMVFPASTASFKERQDYDDVLRDMLRARKVTHEGSLQP